MLRVVAHVVEERGRRGDGLLHQERIGAVQLQQRRQLVANFCPDRRHRIRLRQRAMHPAQLIVEQPLMSAFFNEST